jgi:outer membrane protein OmpA-like peptidoglycan-associated protein
VALLYSAPPFWKPGIVKRELSRSPLLKGDTPIYFTRKVALRMLYELDQGMQPMLFYRDWADATEDVTVAVSNVNFRKVFPDFAACQGQLLSFGFDDVKNVSILFDSGSARLSAADRQLLDKVATYVANDLSIKQVRIAGHADSIGFRYLNELLSKRRARNVQNYLVSKNVDKRKIRLVAYGETLPQKSNATIAGRQKNRRVELVLIK